MLLLLALIVGSVNGAWAQSDYSSTYTSNVTLSTTGGTKAEACKVVIDETEYDGIKIGTGSAVGACKITVPTGARYLHMHVSGWHGVTNLSLKITGITPVPSDITVVADEGVSNNSPFTLQSTPNTSDFYKVIDFGKALVNDTELTFTTSGKKRCVIFGVNSEAGSIVKTDPTITFSNGIVRVGKTLDLSTLFTSNSSGAVTYSITEGGSNATIDGCNLTGVAEGTVTVKATQAAADNYNEGEASATITIEAALTLSSIAITKAPNKTTYTEGESFDATGMVITATYTNSSTEDVTALCTWAPDGPLSTTDKTITFSYEENDITKNTTQAITVNELVLTSPVNINLNNTLFGVETGNNADEQSKEVNGVTITTGCTSSASSKTYYAADHIRFYDESYLTIEVPNGFVITGITLNRYNSDRWDGNKVEPSTGSFAENNSNTAPLVWSGMSKSVTFSYSGQCRTASVEVRLAKTATISLNAACNDGEGNIYGTYSNSKAFVVPADLTVSAISVTGNKLTVTNYSEGNIVKANTGVMVSSTKAGDHTILLSNETGIEKDGNMLKASSAAMTGSFKFYRLTMYNKETIGFYWGAADGAAFAIDANKAYLAVPTALARVAGFNLFEEEGEATAIEGVKTIDTDAPVFNLNGQRVNGNAKGLLIKNGKKFMNR